MQICPTPMLKLTNNQTSTNLETGICQWLQVNGFDLTDSTQKKTEFFEQRKVKMFNLQSVDTDAESETSETSEEIESASSANQLNTPLLKIRTKVRSYTALKNIGKSPLMMRRKRSIKLLKCSLQVKTSFAQPMALTAITTFMD